MGLLSQMESLVGGFGGSWCWDVGGSELSGSLGDGEKGLRVTSMLCGVAGGLCGSLSRTGESGRKVGSVNVDSVIGHDSSEPLRLEGAAPIMSSESFSGLV